ncbi:MULTISPECIES: winged helix-turn-helix transcriptional regulator [Methylococcus]|uniref:Helix-turn-helix transcriptional regulator n=1 Tax=Methylococcus capsulatus TaxID=414 RepID=A0ABZ2F7H4_METCP|nr:MULTISPECIES: helix-turn-helix domain-containing protein [Methylococcus]MDF9393720.1 transcriptional regulator [Methylococcus capsulatus]
MQRTSFKNMECPAARALECVGEWWSMLILRDAFQGLTRFDEFQASLGIAPNILTRRLKHLTMNGLLERRMYNPRPPRYEYLLTAKGRDFFPVLAAMLAWGNKHLTPEGISVQLADRRSGERVEPVLVDGHTLAPITPENVMLQPGPAASPQVRLRARLSRARSANTAPPDQNTEKPA